MMLAAYPTEDTKNRIKQKIASAPLSIDTEKILIPICQVDNWGSQSTQYQVNLRYLNIRYNATLGRSQLAAEVISESLKAVAASVGYTCDFAIAEGNNEQRPLLCVFMDYAPPLSPANKAFIVSLSDSLAQDQEPFTFNLLATP